MMKSEAKAVVDWTMQSFQLLKAQHADSVERDIFQKLLDLRGKFPRGDIDRDIVVDRYGTSINGICYYIGLNSGLMKKQMVSRGVQFTEYIDLELNRRGFEKPSNEIKKGYFKTLGLPESAVEESYL